MNTFSTVVAAGIASAIAILGLATVKPATAAEFVTFEIDP
ncbi:hypothetical protein MiAbW_02074 [Microcystis aeruginosa NIES-4325]|uniref:Uncharacterized protein n=1 Tax=Microcystis aeruginosa NIES-4325 TaxID=2569534 RepID=A0A5J4FAI2_MICAE|nr:hypothetical protein MiAbW_02074 [Microcystis aeruginosa NIES-4325]